MAREHGDQTPAVEEQDQVPEEERMDPPRREFESPASVAPPVKRFSLLLLFTVIASVFSLVVAAMVSLRAFDVARRLDANVSETARINGVVEDDIRVAVNNHAASLEALYARDSTLGVEIAHVKVTAIAALRNADSAYVSAKMANAKVAVLGKKVAGLSDRDSILNEEIKKVSANTILVIGDLNLFRNTQDSVNAANTAIIAEFRSWQESRLSQQEVEKLREGLAKRRWPKEPKRKG